MFTKSSIAPVAILLAIAICAIVVNAAMADDPASSGDGGSDTIEIGYTHAERKIVVPAGTTNAYIEAAGGGGGGRGGGHGTVCKERCNGGRGALVRGNVKVAPGDVLTVTVASGGEECRDDHCSNGGSGGWPGGSINGWSSSAAERRAGSGGGGRTTVTLTDGDAPPTLVAVAGGGGGAGGIGAAAGIDNPGRGGDAGGEGLSNSLNGEDGEGPKHGKGGQGAAPTSGGPGGGGADVAHASYDAGGGGGGGAGVRGGDGGGAGGLGGGGGGGGGAGSSAGPGLTQMVIEPRDDQDPRGDGFVKIYWGTRALFQAGENGPASIKGYDFSYTGSPVEITVPAGVTGAHVHLEGAAGGKTSGKPPGIGNAGSGMSLEGNIELDPGDRITIGVGGKGGNGDGNNSPGEGGWGIDENAHGGRGGSSRGHGAYRDGAGGGGATVIEVNGDPRAIAAGGGGAAFSSESGGNGGLVVGLDGSSACQPGQQRSHGGASSHTRYDPSGSSIGPHALGDGGGGGGGGQFNGEGGGAFPACGGGGGGGASLVPAKSWTGQAGVTGDGSASLTWIE